MSFRTVTLEGFNARVQERTPTPGGGAVSALAGSLAASLGVMAAGFTLGRAEAAPAAAEVERLRAELGKASSDLLTLADDDARAYDGFGAALKLPKGTPEEKKLRREAMQEALRRAADVPLAGMRLCVDVLRRLQALLPHSNPNLVSDLGVGALLASAAFHGCRLNVQVNLASITDAAFVERMRGEVVPLVERADGLSRAILHALDGPR